MSRLLGWFIHRWRKRRYPTVRMIESVRAPLWVTEEQTYRVPDTATEVAYRLSPERTPFQRMTES